jgi:hypothetical protein
LTWLLVYATSSLPNDPNGPNRPNPPNDPNDPNGASILALIPRLRVADIRSSCSIGITSMSVNPTLRNCGTKVVASPTSTIDNLST